MLSRCLELHGNIWEWGIQIFKDSYMQVRFLDAINPKPSIEFLSNIYYGNSNIYEVEKWSYVATYLRGLCNQAGLLLLVNLSGSSQTVFHLNYKQKKSDQQIWKPELNLLSPALTTILPRSGNDNISLAIPYTAQLARKLYESMRREAASVCVQKNVRAHTARRNYTNLQASAMAIQTGLRAMAARNEFRYRRRTKAATLIQVEIQSS